MSTNKVDYKGFPWLLVNSDVTIQPIISKTKEIFNLWTMQQEEDDIYSIIIDSRNRIEGTPENFKVVFNPQLTNVKKLSLQSTHMGFNFNNVTETYGRRLRFNLTWSSGVVQSHVELPIGRYSLVELLVAINTELQAFFNNTFATSPPFTLSLSAIPNRVLISYDPTFFTAPATLTFLVPANNTSTNLPLSYLLTMLGLSTDIANPTVFTFPVLGPFVGTFPNPATAQLPISYIIINVEGVPSKVLTSAQIGGTFYVDVNSTNISSQVINAPNDFKSMTSYYNEVNLQRGVFNFAYLRVFIVDNFGQPLLDQNVIDWHFSFIVSRYHNSRQ